MAIYLDNKQKSKQDQINEDISYAQGYAVLNWMGRKVSSLVISSVKAIVEMGVTDIEPSVLKRYSSLRKGHEPRVALHPNMGISSPRESGDLNLIPELIDKGYVKKEDRLGPNSCTNRVANLFKETGMLE
jgi:hypothetical protein